MDSYSSCIDCGVLWVEVKECIATRFVLPDATAGLRTSFSGDGYIVVAIVNMYQIIKTTMDFIKKSKLEPIWLRWPT